jgi:hypothetical protein
MTAVLAALLLSIGFGVAILAIRHADAAERPGPRLASHMTASARDPLTVPSAEATTPAEDRMTEEKPSGHLLAWIDGPMPLYSRPGGRKVATAPAASPFYGEPTAAWVLELSEDGRFGRVPIPYAGRDVTGWLRLRGLRTSTTRVSIGADLSRHRLWVYRGERVVFSARTATGAPASPTPTGRYVVSDRVAFPGGGMLGTYAFGLSGIQPNLPPGWSGGNQLAIHGTSDPSSIGSSASAGCLRVSERVLDRLKGLLQIGTPVLIHA